MGIFNFLSSRNASKPLGNSAAIAAPQSIQAMDTASFVASDEREWLRYLSQALRTYRKPGVSLKEEHQQWLAARARQRALVPASATRTARAN